MQHSLHVRPTAVCNLHLRGLMATRRAPDTFCPGRQLAKNRLTQKSFEILQCWNMDFIEGRMTFCILFLKLHLINNKKKPHCDDKFVRSFK